MRVGVISDTHGLLRPEAVRALRGSDLIVHAGDIGGPDILDSLRALAPVHVVRGNNDRDGWARQLPDTDVFTAGGVRLLVVHDLATLVRDPAGEGLRAVIAGHSHQPRNEKRAGILYFNPGSAGPRRFSLPVTVGRLDIEDGKIVARIIPLL